MKPFSNSSLNKEERAFNYHLSRVRRVVENGFGILDSRFRVFHTTINLKPETVDNSVLGACVLHRRNARPSYISLQSVDVEDTENGNITGGPRFRCFAFRSTETGIARMKPNDNGCTLNDTFNSLLMNHYLL